MPNDEPTGVNDSSPPSGENPDSNEEVQPPKKDAEARINQLVSQVKSQAEEIEAIKNQPKVPMPPVPSDEPSAAEKQALGKLKDLGLVDIETLDKKFAEAKQESEDRWFLTNEHQKNESLYDGSDGRPKYDNKEVEKYMREQGIAQPEVAYKTMHEKELLDWNLKQANQTTETGQPYTTPPAPSGQKGENYMSRELIAEKQKELSPTEFRQWYEDKRETIGSLLRQGQLQ